MSLKGSINIKPHEFIVGKSTVKIKIYAFQFISEAINMRGQVDGLMVIFADSSQSLQLSELPYTLDALKLHPLPISTIQCYLPSCIHSFH